MAWNSETGMFNYEKEVHSTSTMVEKNMKKKYSFNTNEQVIHNTIYNGKGHGIPGKEISQMSFKGRSQSAITGVTLDMLTEM